MGVRGLERGIGLDDAVILQRQDSLGEIDPVSASALCDGLGIKVYTIGVGNSSGVVPVPLQVRDSFTGLPIRSTAPDAALG